jgi:hypothetical protein
VPLTTYDVAGATEVVRWIQEKNHLAFVLHRKRRVKEQINGTKCRYRVNCLERSRPSLGKTRLNEISSASHFGLLRGFGED